MFVRDPRETEQDSPVGLCEIAKMTIKIKQYDRQIRQPGQTV
jgi:hypothetical protein